MQPGPSPFPSLPPGSKVARSGLYQDKTSSLSLHLPPTPVPSHCPGGHTLLIQKVVRHISCAQTWAVSCPQG